MILSATPVSLSETRRGTVMPMTMSEKLLARKAGKVSVSAGDLVTAKPDVIMSNDITTAMSAIILQDYLDGRARC